jgi:hypothetical protein
MTGAGQSGLLENLLNDGWRYHDKESERLARELEAAALDGVAPHLLLPFAHLSIHTMGEHLGDWPRALALGKRVLQGETPAAETAKAWGRVSIAALLAGDAVEAAQLELTYLKAAGDDLGPALLDIRFMLANALIGSKRMGEGAALYRDALDLARRIGPSALLDRTVAVASNNLGWELYERPSRTLDEDALMQLSAETSLEFWLRCGNWINEERGLYLKALVANATGDPERGLAHADVALAVIKANGERPLDAALLQLARAASLGELGDADRKVAAMEDADAAAAKLASQNLKQQFDAERAKVIAAWP